eukprot:g24378.t1
MNAEPLMLGAQSSTVVMSDLNSNHSNNYENMDNMVMLDSESGNPLTTMHTLNHIVLRKDSELSPLMTEAKSYSPISFNSPISESSKSPQSFRISTARDTREDPQVKPEVKEVRVRVSIKRILAVDLVQRILAVDLVQQSFISEFFLEASWVDSKLGLKYKPDNPPKVDYEQSKFKVGAMYMEGDETKTKYFTPRLQFRNLIEYKREPEEWVAIYPGNDAKAQDAVVCYRLQGIATFQEKMELELFPVDSQDLSMELISGYESQTSKPQEAAAVSTQSSQASNSHRISAVIRRRWGYWGWNVVLPLYLITAVSSACFAVPQNEIGDRTSITLTMMLTTVAYKYLIAGNLPTISYLTLVDIYLLICLLIQVCFVLITVVNGIRWNDKQKKEQKKEDYEWDPWITFVTFMLGWSLFHLSMYFWAKWRMNRRLQQLSASNKYLWISGFDTELEGSKLAGQMKEDYQQALAYLQKQDQDKWGGLPAMNETRPIWVAKMTGREAIDAYNKLEGEKKRMFEVYKTSCVQKKFLICTFVTESLAQAFQTVILEYIEHRRKVDSPKTQSPDAGIRRAVSVFPRTLHRLRSRQKTQVEPLGEDFQSGQRVQPPSLKFLERSNESDPNKLPPCVIETLKREYSYLAHKSADGRT